VELVFSSIPVNFWTCKRLHIHASACLDLCKGTLMIVTVTSYKGGVGKTTTAIHLAAYLQRLAPTLLVDGDGIRSATKWGQRGNGQGLPFKVTSAAQMAKAHPRLSAHCDLVVGNIELTRRE